LRGEGVVERVWLAVLYLGESVEGSHRQAEKMRIGAEDGWGCLKQNGVLYDML